MNKNWLVLVAIIPLSGCVSASKFKGQEAKLTSIQQEFDTTKNNCSAAAEAAKANPSPTPTPTTPAAVQPPPAPPPAVDAPPSSPVVAVAVPPPPQEAEREENPCMRGYVEVKPSGNCIRK